MSSKKYSGKTAGDKDLGKVAGGGYFHLDHDPETGKTKIDAEIDREELGQIHKMMNGGHHGPHGQPFHGGHHPFFGNPPRKPGRADTLAPPAPPPIINLNN